jgi:HK97 family phage major capsid protein
MTDATLTVSKSDFESLTKKYDEQSAELKALKAKPDLSGVRRDDEGRITGYIEPTDEESTIEAYTHVRSETKSNYLRMKRIAKEQRKSFGYQPRNEFKSMGEMIRCMVDNKSRFESRLGTHLKAIQGLSTVYSEDGGSMVVPEFSTGIIDRVYDNPLWGLTDNYIVTGNNLTFTATAETNRGTGTRGGALQGYWMGEGGTITKSKPQVRQITLKLVKLAAVVYLTDEVLADTNTGLEQWISKKVAQEFNFLTGDALFNGTGVGQPLGVMNAPSLVSVAKETGQGVATILPENVVKMYARAYAPNLPNMKFFHNQNIGPQMDLMTLGIGTAGLAVFMPPSGLRDAPYGTLRGLPMQPTEFNASIGTSGDLMLADMGQVVSISKGGVAQAVSMHIEFLTDQVALRFTMRINAMPWENAPITPFKGTSSTQSNFIVLDDR